MSETHGKTGQKQASPLWALPQAYILYSGTTDIIRHMDLRSRIHDLEDIEVDVTQKDNHVTLTIITRDRPGLFSLLTGILALNHLEINSAKVFTWQDGIAVDVFNVIPPWKDYSEWDKIARQFRNATSGKMDIDASIKQTKALNRNDQTPVNPFYKSSLAINNETSDFFTLIEVRAQKRPGLLYQIARIISGFSLDIHRALVSRNTDLCSDVFYVVNELGEKIEDDGLKAKIVEEIQKVMTNSGMEHRGLKDKPGIGIHKHDKIVS